MSDLSGRPASLCRIIDDDHKWFSIAYDLH